MVAVAVAVEGVGRCIEAWQELLFLELKCDRLCHLI